MRDFGSMWPVKTQRNWVGNDASARNHTGVVYLDESPLKIRLSWKSNRKASPKLVGFFDLDLRKLLTDGNVRRERGRSRAIRLRFYHGLEGTVYIQVNRKGPALAVGKVA
jgi:hypothetical protein